MSGSISVWTRSSTVMRLTCRRVKSGIEGFHVGASTVGVAVHGLHSSDSAIGEPDFDAAGVVSFGENILDVTGYGAAGGLVGFEDDVDAGVGDDLSDCWYSRHVWGLRKAKLPGTPASDQSAAELMRVATVLGTGPVTELA